MKKFLLLFLLFAGTVHAQTAIPGLRNPTDSAGQVPTSNADGTVSWQTAGGGGSGNAILNQDTGIQTGANFNIKGNGAIGGWLNVGNNNTVSAYSSLIAGADLVINATYGVVLGVSATDTNDNCFIWGDNSHATFTTEANEFIARASGGFQLFSTTSATPDVTVTSGNMALTGALVLPAIADSAAPNSSIYVSSDQANKLVWKDASGTVHVVTTIP